MIRTAREEERGAIRQIWKKAFAADDGGYTDFYFHTLFCAERTLVNEVGGKIASVLELRPHTLCLGDKRIGCFLIEGVATVPELQHRGYMRQLMERALEISDRQVLVTLVQEYAKGLYEPFGFVPTYFAREYTFPSRDYPNYEHSEVREGAAVKDLELIYQRFLGHFQGYYALTKQRYPDYLEQLRYEQGCLYAYYKQGSLKGYYAGYRTGQKLRIDELMYDNGEALAKLLAHAASAAAEVTVRVSAREDLSHFLPRAAMTMRQETLVRINDPELFRKCFQLGNGSIDALWAAKPLYLRECS